MRIRWFTSLPSISTHSVLKTTSRRLSFRFLTFCEQCRFWTNGYPFSTNQQPFEVQVP